MPDVILRCSAASGFGTALANGHNMTFSQFTYLSLYKDTDSLSNYSPLDPIAVITQTNMFAYQHSIFVKLFSANISAYTDDTSEHAAAMWDGVLAMTLPLWSLWGLSEHNRSGIQRLEASGIHRDNSALSALVVLLGIWFAGILLATLALLRPTWSSTFDSYAIARMLQHQPVVLKTEKVWFSGLEENEESQQQFEIHQWRSDKP